MQYHRFKFCKTVEISYRFWQTLSASMTEDVVCLISITCEETLHIRIISKQT